MAYNYGGNYPPPGGGYGSNYPPPSGGFNSAYPPNSGPPPPGPPQPPGQGGGYPAGGYGGGYGGQAGYGGGYGGYGQGQGYGGGYQQQQQSAYYNPYNAPGYQGGYPQGGHPPSPGPQQPYQGYGGGYQGYNNPAAVPGYTAPAQPPPPQGPYGQNPNQMTPAMHYNSAQQHMANSTLHAFQLDTLKQMGIISDDEDAEDAQERRRRRRRKKREEEEEAEDGGDDEDGSEEEEDLQDRVTRKLDSDVELKARLKEIFVEELTRRMDFSGTFEITQGTVKKLVKYPGDDPVTVFYQSEREEDLTGKAWDREADCEYLRKSMRGMGTDEDAIIHICATRSNAQRVEIGRYYKTMYGRDIFDDIEKELSGDFKHAVEGLFIPPATFDALCIKRAIYGLGTDEVALIELLLTRTNSQIEEMKNEYPGVIDRHSSKKKGKGVLEQDITDDTGGDFKRLLISALQANRNEISREQLEGAVEEIMANERPTGMYQVNYDKLVDLDKCHKDAERLVKAGEGRWGTDEETFNVLFSIRDIYHLRSAWTEYVKLTQRDILNSVDRETSGDFKKALRCIVQMVKCRPMYFAEQLYKSMKGAGTDENTLIRIVISRSEIDMVQIKECFLERYKSTLHKWIEEDFSGDCKKILQSLVGKN